MKLTDQQRKKYFAKHAKKQLKKRLQHKDFRKRKNIEINGLSYIQRKQREARKQREIDVLRFVEVEAPENFSFENEPEKLIRFITRIKSNFESRIPTWVKLRNVVNVDNDALLILLSTMVHFKAKRIEYNGDFPRDRGTRTKIEKSGFFENLNRKFAKTDKYELLEDGNFITNANKVVDSKLSDELIGKAAKVIWGEKRRCKGAQRSLIELMQNTKDHATPEGLDDTGKHWWLSVKHDRINKTVSFSFVDYGIGIFESLKNKPSSSKFFGGVEKLIRKFQFKENNELLKLILNGDLHETVTGKKYRGKGLPGIKEAYQMGYISKLLIITNNVYADVENDEYRRLRTKLSGTFVRFELQANNKNEVWSI